MPHDCNGDILNVGDDVIFRAKVEKIEPCETYCNCSVKAIRVNEVGEDNMQEEYITTNSKFFEKATENTCEAVSETQNETIREMSMNERCDELRVIIGNMAARTKNLKIASVFKGEQSYQGQHGEMIANIMLAYRHLEDARMRIGKILQAADDGVSILDK